MPLYQAIVLTFPERVTEYNMAKLKMRVLNGSATWPGANFVQLQDGARIWLRDEKIRRKYANELKVCRLGRESATSSSNCWCVAMPSVIGVLHCNPTKSLLLPAGWRCRRASLGEW